MVSQLQEISFLLIPKLKESNVFYMFTGSFIFDKYLTEYLLNKYPNSHTPENVGPFTDMVNYIKNIKDKILLNNTVTSSYLSYIDGTFSTSERILMFLGIIEEIIDSKFNPGIGYIFCTKILHTMFDNFRFPTLGSIELKTPVFVLYEMCKSKMYRAQHGEGGNRGLTEPKYTNNNSTLSILVNGRNTVWTVEDSKNEKVNKNRVSERAIVDLRKKGFKYENTLKHVTYEYIYPSNYDGLSESLLKVFDKYFTEYSDVLIANLEQFKIAFTSNEYYPNYEFLEYAGDSIVNKIAMNYLTIKLDVLKSYRFKCVINKIHGGIKDTKFLSNLLTKLGLRDQIKSNTISSKVMEDVFEAFSYVVCKTLNDRFGYNLGFVVYTQFLFSLLDDCVIDIDYFKYTNFKSQLQEFTNANPEKIKGSGIVKYPSKTGDKKFTYRTSVEFIDTSGNVLLEVSEHMNEQECARIGLLKIKKILKEFNESENLEIFNEAISLLGRTTV